MSQESEIMFHDVTKEELCERIKSYSKPKDGSANYLFAVTVNPIHDFEPFYISNNNGHYLVSTKLRDILRDLDNVEYFIQNYTRKDGVLSQSVIPICKSNALALKITSTGTINN